LPKQRLLKTKEKKEKMTFNKNRSKCFLAVVLLLSLAVTMFALPATTAHTPA
jgi:hypothetical protein